MSELRNEFKSWKTARDKIFCCVVTISALGIFMLFGSILDNTGTRSINNVNITTFDSVQQEIAAKIQSLRKDTVNKDLHHLQWKLDSLCIMQHLLQTTLLEIEEQTEQRQNDIRQEMNNIINNFNGIISWWLLLLGIVCGFAPLVLAYLNHKNDSEYLKLLNMNYNEVIKKVEKGDELLGKRIEEIKNAEKEREHKLEESRKELKLMHAFIYATSFTRNPKFQQSPERVLIAEKLLEEIIQSSLSCIQTDESVQKKDIDWLYWIMASLEGIRLIIPFQKDRHKIRKMNDIITGLKNIQELYYKESFPIIESPQMSDLQSKIKQFYAIYYSRT